MKPLGYIIVWDDEQGVCSPMGWDLGCEGAVCCHSGEVALFKDTKSARRALRISEAFSKLLIAQGKPANTDFIGECRKHLKILPIMEAPCK